MPDQTSHLTALRGRHNGRVYLSRLTGTPVLTGTLTAAPTLPALTLGYTLTGGSAANVKPGMRAVITSASGAYKGTLSIRYAGSITSASLPVREFADLSLSAGDGITVYDDFVLTDKLVSGDETFAPDHAAYVDQHSDPAPLAVSGGVWAGWIGATGTVDVPFSGSGSYTVDPDSVGTVSHLWTAPGGSFAVGSSSSADPTIRFNAAGKYLITHTVTDSSNGKSETQYIRVRVHDADDPPDDCLLSSMDGDPRGGFRVTVQLFEQTDLASLPDLAPVILWTDGDAYGSATAGRSHILCAGYLRRDRSSGDADGDAIEFEVISPLARLAELPGFSKALIRTASPDAWGEVRGLTVKRAIITILRHYTNALSLFDLHFAGFPDADYSAFYLQKATPYEQVIELADSRDARFTCDRAGRFEVARRLEFTPLADRNALTTTITLNADDLLDYEISREHGRTLETFRARGFTAGADANNPAFARFPASPGTGNASPISERLIVDDQADLLARCAMRGAWADSLYIDANGTLRHAPEIRLTLFGAYAGLFQFYREWVKLDGVTNLRGVDLAAFRWIPQRVSVEFADGTATTRLDLQAETYATGAVDDTPAAELLPPFDPPVLLPSAVVPIDYALTGLGRGAGTLAAFATDNAVYITGNFGAITPTWARHALTVSGTLTGFVVDAYSPLYLRTGTTVNGWIVTTNAIYRIADIFGARTLTLRHTWDTPAFDLPFIEASFGAQNRVVAVTGNRGHATYPGTRAAYTLDDVTWTEVTVSPHYQSNTGLGCVPSLHVSSHTIGRAYTLAFNVTGSGTAATTRLFESLDGGATWALSSDPAVSGQITPGAGLHVPFHDNADDALVYWTYLQNSADQRLYQSSGTLQTNITPGGAYWGQVLQRALVTHPLDRRRGLLIGLANGLGSVKQWRTFDGGATWTDCTWDTALPQQANFAGDSLNTIYVWGASGYIAVSFDFAATVYDKRGNIASFAPGRIVNLCGG